MSDMIPQAQAAQRPAQKPMMEQLRSPSNPADAVMMAKRGEMGRTFGEAMERQYGVKWDDPIDVASKKILEVTQMAKPENKTAAMAGGGPGMPGGPPPPPQRGNPPAPGGSPIAGIMQKYGG